MFYMVVPRAELRPTRVRLLALLRDKTPTAAVVPIKPGRKSAARKPALAEASPAPEATPQEAAGAATNADEGDAPPTRCAAIRPSAARSERPDQRRRPRPPAPPPPPGPRPPPLPPPAAALSPRPPR